jgi:hypothetical protein
MVNHIAPRPSRLRLRGRACAVKPRHADRTTPRIRAGLSAERRAAFLAALANAGSFEEALKSAEVDRAAALALRARDPSFARAWDQAQDQRLAQIEAMLVDRAIEGLARTDGGAGDRVAEAAARYSANLGMWLLEARMPHRYAKPGRSAATAPSPAGPAPGEDPAARVSRLIALAEERLQESEQRLGITTSGPDAED